MRPIRQDIAGITDANGNLTLPIKRPVTGEWLDVKFALSVAIPATGPPFVPAWTISSSGTVLTYGYGVHATLGPELIQDGETVSIAVAAGPPNTAVLGSMVGKAGTPDEILAGYNPAPNIIALDRSTGLFVPLTFHGNIPGTPVSTTFLASNALVTYELHKLIMSADSTSFNGGFTIFFQRTSDNTGLANFRAASSPIVWDFEGLRLAKGDGVVWGQDSGAAKFADVTLNYRKV